MIVFLFLPVACISLAAQQARSSSQAGAKIKVLTSLNDFTRFLALCSNLSCGRMCRSHRLCLVVAVVCRLRRPLSIGTKKESEQNQKGLSRALTAITR